MLLATYAVMFRQIHSKTVSVGIFYVPYNHYYSLYTTFFFKRSKHIVDRISRGFR